MLSPTRKLHKTNTFIYHVLAKLVNFFLFISLVKQIKTEGPAGKRKPTTKYTRFRETKMCQVFSQMKK